MAKKVLYLLLALCFITSCLPFAVSADGAAALPETLYIGDVSVVENGELQSDTSAADSSWSFDADSATLTLSNATITASNPYGDGSYCGIYCKASADVESYTLNIDLEGVNTVTAPSDDGNGGVERSYGILTVHGQEEDSSNQCNAVINAADGASLTATGGTAVVDSMGLYIDGTLTVNGGTINATGSDVSNTDTYARSAGITASDAVIFDGEIVADGGDVASSGQAFSYGIDSTYGTYIAGGTVNATGGTAAADAGNTALSYGLHNGVTVDGAAVVVATGNAASCAGGTAISGGIHGYSNDNCPVGIGCGADVTAEGDTYGIYTEAADISISHAGTVVSAKGGSAAVLSGGSLSIEYLAIQTPSGGRINDDGNTVVDDSGNTATDVTIEGRASDLYVNGVAMSDGEYLASGSDSTIDSQPSGGYAYYSGGTLTLNNYSNSGVYPHNAAWGLTSALYSAVPLEIELIGTSSLTNTDEYSNGITFDGASGSTLTVSGDGTLNINAEYGIASQNGNINITDGVINIESAGSGIEVGYGNISITGGTVDITVSDGGFAVNSFNNITISNVSILQPEGGSVIQTVLGNNRTVYRIADTSGNAPTRVVIGTETPAASPTPTVPSVPTEEEITVPISGNDNAIQVDASLSGTTATIENVDLTQLDSVIGDDVDTGTVTIDFSEIGTDVDEVIIPAEVMDKIAEAVSDPENDADSLEIVLSDGTAIEFDATALAEKVEQAGGSDITITIEESSGTGAQQAAVGNRPAYDITVSSGGQNISDLGGKVKIRVPYLISNNEKPLGIVVYYVDDNGNKESCATVYDTVNAEVSWETDHLSLYMIGYDAVRAENPFDDVPSNTYYSDAVKWAIENGITNGIGNNKFGPNQSCTRAQAVTFLWRAAGSPTVSGSTGFEDVSEGSYYANAVKWAVQNGIANGVGGGKFAPNATCTRAQIVTFLYRAASSPAVSGDTVFTDVPSSAYYVDAVKWAVQNGVANGMGNNKFSPSTPCTRGQIVTFLYRYAG